MNPANAVSASRIVLVGPFAACMVLAGQAGQGKDGLRLLAAGIFAVASLTDYLDGYLARRMKLESEVGQWLDPLADKILVGAALIALVVFRDFPLWAAVVIGIREVAVASLRSAVVRRGQTMPAARAAKLKTAIQIPMVFAWLLDRGPGTAYLQDAALYLALGLTLFSGAQYFAKSRSLLRREGSKAK